MDIPRTEVQSPERKIYIVSVFSTVISMAMFFAAVGHIVYVKVKNVDCSRHPVAGAHFFISLVVLSVAAYQAVISALVYVQTRAVTKRQSTSSISSNHCAQMIFVISVWFTSHLSILPLYWALIILELTVTILSRSYVLILIAAVFGVVYQCIFTYFVVVMYRFLRMNRLLLLE